MTDGFASPDERLEQPIDTDMPHSTSDVRDLADVVRSLAGAIDDAIDLINGAYEDTEDGGWDDDGADRFRASLSVGRDNATDLEADVRTYAQKLDEYANALSAADERLERARETARGADLLDGKVIHPPDAGVYVGERMMAPDQREPNYDERQATEDAYYTARAEFDAAATALQQSDGIPQFAEDAVKQVYFSGNAFIKGEIEEVAKWYNQGSVRPQLLFDHPRGPRPPHTLLPEVADDLLLRAVKSYGGSVINVFGVAFDIYTGTPVEKAIFIGIGGALGGIAFGAGLGALVTGPPGWATIAAAGVGSGIVGAGSNALWENTIPEDVKDWFDEQRQEARDINKTREDGILWNEYYEEAREGTSPSPRDIDLEAP